MKRRLLNLATGISLLLCVATLVLWVRSYRSCEGIGHARVHPTGVGITRDAIYCQEGRVVLGHTSRTQPGSRGTLWGDVGWNVLSDPVRKGSLQAAMDRFGHEVLGFGFAHARQGPGAEGSIVAWWEVVVPHWALVLAFGAMPVAEARRALRYHMSTRSGHCPNCGYDLRATPERCPECGAVPQVAGKTVA